MDRAAESRVARTFCASAAGRKGFCKNAAPFWMPSFKNDILGVSGHEHDLHARPEFEGAFGEFASAEFRHHHIGHQQIDRALMGFAERQPSLSVAGLR